jgi:hypothetical protein
MAQGSPWAVPHKARSYRRAWFSERNLWCYLGFIFSAAELMQ